MLDLNGRIRPVICHQMLDFKSPETDAIAFSLAQFVGRRNFPSSIQKTTRQWLEYKEPRKKFVPLVLSILGYPNGDRCFPNRYAVHHPLLLLEDTVDDSGARRKLCGNTMRDTLRETAPLAAFTLGS
ncbi:unnamed protein product [Orchesella dallaii]|uniref:Uncharacterized protein n=1 Tax=Orchesella dallaii TaxID=48710 RepID=A0ABP1RLZ8_9HEXA